MANSLLPRCFRGNSSLSSARLVSRRNSISSNQGTQGRFEFPANHYNRVERIILVRHGESLGNVDETTYVSTADWRIPLTQRGKRQALVAGKNLSDIVGGDGRRVFFYVSPYVRARQTLQGMLTQLPKSVVAGIREEPRVSEQQFGNFQCADEVAQAKEERKSFGRFFFRFPNGEAGFDVYNRVSSFIATVIRDCAQLRAEGEDLKDYNICVVTHGLTLRLFLMRWFQYTVEEFEESLNPANGSVIVLERHTNLETGRQWFELNESARETLNFPRFQEQRKFRLFQELSSFDC